MQVNSRQAIGRIPDKVALVTGAASGIGRATAITFANHGATVVCADLNLIGVEETAAAITAASGSATACKLDVTAEADWRAAMELVGTLGHLDILVNCAGISHACPVAEISLEDWRRVLAINLDGAVLGTQHAIRAMRQDPRGGSIVNVSSASGTKAAAGASAYCTSKAAVIMFSKVAALECLNNGDRIRINTVSPSGVKTPMWKTMPFFQDLIAREGSEEAAFQAMAKAGPAHGRWAMPEEIALGILYLASDESLFVTGTDLVIDNGYTV
jgi:NAD(P)-dependent dehydrogenase (short-subunit alcohol dehydrogenase family)